MSLKVKKSTLIFVIVFSVLTYLNVIIYGEKIPQQLIVNPLCLIPFIVSIFLLEKIKLRLVSLLIKFWIYYFICGVLFTSQSYLEADVWKLDVSNTAFIYGFFLVAFIVGCLFWQDRVRKKNTMSKTPLSIPVWVKIFLIVFPFLWLFSFFYTVGYLPILSGVSFYDDVYNMNYGSLYGYIVVLSISFIFFYSRYLSAVKKSQKIIWAALCVFVVFISLVDGKRYTILTSLIALMAYIIAYTQFRLKLFHYLLFGCIGFALYTGINLIRTGEISGSESSKALFKLPTGVEFRDFVYTENNFQPGGIKGYDFIASSVASIVNGKVLQIAGVDKAELTKQGSAYAWADIYNQLFGTEFGIRTGIFSELFFAFSYYGIILLLLFSYLAIKICYVIEAKKYDKFYVLIACVLFGLLVMLIVGQATAFFGQAVLLLYFILAYWVHKKVAKQNS